MLGKKDKKMINCTYASMNSKNKKIQRIKRLALIATTALAVGTAIYLIKNRTLKKDIFTKTEKNINTQTNPNIPSVKQNAKIENQTPTAAIKNYYFQKGKAYNNDGSLFSGIITEKTKSSDTFEIAYKDGLPQTSTKNGKLMKKWGYSKTNEEIPSTKIEIEEYDGDQNIAKKTYLFIRNRLKRLITADYNKKTLNATDFSNEGKIKRKTNYFANFSPNSRALNEEIESQTEYDKTGNVISKIQFHPFDRCNITVNNETKDGIYRGHSINFDRSDSLVDIMVPKSKNRFIRSLSNFTRGFKN